MTWVHLWTSCGSLLFQGESQSKLVQEVSRSRREHSFSGCWLLCKQFFLSWKKWRLGSSEQHLYQDNRSEGEEQQADSNIYTLLMRQLLFAVFVRMFWTKNSWKHLLKSTYRGIIYLKIQCMVYSSKSKINHTSTCTWTHLNIYTWWMSMYVLFLVKAVLSKISLSWFILISNTVVPQPHRDNNNFELQPPHILRIISAIWEYKCVGLNSCNTWDLSLWSSASYIHLQNTDV